MKSLSTQQVSDELAEQVLGELVREADLDGVVITPAAYIAERIGVTRASVAYAIQQLIDAGRLLDEGREAGRGAVRRLRLADTG